jgi:capsular polysaccharide export protein
MQVSHLAPGLLGFNRTTALLPRKHCVCPGYTLWKRPIARTLLAAFGCHVSFTGRREDAVAQAQETTGQVVVWASEESPDLDARCRAAGVPLVRMEDGFIRSIGLGSDFSWPFSMVLDQGGIYYDPESPSDLERLLAETDFTPELVERAARLRQAILAAAVTKYAVGAGHASLPGVPPGRRRILVPGQVESDASVHRGGGGMHSNLDLLRAVRAGNRDAYVVFKQHPDVVRGNRPGLIPAAELAGLVDAQADQMDISALFECVDEVHTLTSLAGFEALLRGKQVCVYGGPFYAGWGLTQDRLAFPRRRRRLQLDELVAATLILYPTYYDWLLGRVCEPEQALARLRERGLPWMMRARSRFYFTVRGLLKVTHTMDLIRWLKR